VALPTDGSVGVLIRVEDGGIARIDFGRDGLREVPIAMTDLVDRANRVRSGELVKLAPNFVLAIGRAWIGRGQLRVRSRRTEPGFLCLRRPGRGGLPDRRALAPINERQA
jgi:hypothetical protein